ncbi:MAG: hypothetical protein E7549_04900 [Ruminococcaceae bacterium]|nr:hypothetical protein [Oscillospiraceae bacterium]
MTQLQLGIGREIITPAVGGALYGYRPDLFSTAVNDDLTATAFLFRQGDTTALMVSLTVCELQTAFAARICAKIETLYGIPAAHCLLCATHTHSAPNVAGTVGWGDIDVAYSENVFVPAILRAVKTALDTLQPVKTAVAVGDSRVGVNRRELTTDNTVALGQNPWGCLDTKMTVLSFCDAAGTVVANMIHYGAHGTAAGANTEITRDWSGIMTDAVEAQSGGVTAFFNGTMGDVGPRISNGKTVGDLRYVRELGEIAARDALAVYRTLGEYTDMPLKVSSKVLSVPQKKRMARTEAETLLTQCANNGIGSDEMIRVHCEEVLRSYETGYTDTDTFPLKQTVIVLGNIAFAAFPFEIFSEIGLRCDRAVEDLSVRVLSNVNGFEGYFVTEDALCRGGYEVGIFLYSHLQPPADNADYHLMKQTVQHINETDKKGE